MPRATPVNQRKKTALAYIVDANDSGRYVAGMLRRPKTDWAGNPVVLNKTEAEHMLTAISNAQTALKMAAAHVEALWHLVPKAPDA